VTTGLSQKQIIYSLLVLQQNHWTVLLIVKQSFTGRMWRLINSVLYLGMRPVVLIEKPAVVRMEFFLGKVSLFLHVSKLPRITVVLMTNWLSTKVV
jgi:hypothetical protein